MSSSPKIISYTRVSADIFHYGHLRLFQNAKKVADYHICGVYNDELCRKWNGNLIMNYKESLAILNQLKCVDEVLKQAGYHIPVVDDDLEEHVLAEFRDFLDDVTPDDFLGESQ